MIIGNDLLPWNVLNTPEGSYPGKLFLPTQIIPDIVVVDLAGTLFIRILDQKGDGDRGPASRFKNIPG